MVVENEAFTNRRPEVRPSESGQTCPPYVAGQTIKLTLENGSTMMAEIQQIYPFTLSCAMRIRPYEPHDPTIKILKMYDRRYAAGLRSKIGARSWNPVLETEYDTFINSAYALESYHQWEQTYDKRFAWRNPGTKSWSEGKLEAYLQYLSLKAYHTECTAYRAMEKLQGRFVPILYNQVSVDPPTSNKAQYKFKRVPGILLEYIEGFTLEELQNRVPQPDWQIIGDEAISIVHAIGDCGICNRDVQLRSIIVKEDYERKRYILKMIDFGLCSFRDQAESAREFRKWQASEDEEGAIGVSLAHELKGGFVYHESKRAEALSAEFNTEETYINS